MNEIIIPAIDRWYRTGRILTAGKRYRFTLVSTNELRDAGKVPVDLDGWETPFFKKFAWLLREASEPFFALIGTVDQSHPFRIHPKPGAPVFIEAPASGELVCYFNDVWQFYFNNHGVAVLTLEEI